MTRYTHDRATSKETFSALLVQLTSAVGDIAQGEDVESVLSDIWLRMEDLDGPPRHSFTIDAVIST